MQYSAIRYLVYLSIIWRLSWAIPLLRATTSTTYVDRYLTRNLNTGDPTSRCDILALSESPLDFVSTTFPIKIATNFSLTHPITKCLFIYVLLENSDPESIVNKTSELISRRPKIMTRIWGVVGFLESNWKTNHKQLSRWAKIMNKETVFVQGERKIKFNGRRRCRFEDVKCSLNNREIKLAYSSSRPWFYLRNWENDDALPNGINMSPENVLTMGHHFEGVEAELVKHLIVEYNMSFTLENYVYGTNFPNGTWTGKLGAIRAAQVDIVAGCIPGNFKKNQIAHFSSPIYYYYFKIISLKPGPLPNLLAPVRPFQSYVWVAILASITFAGAAVWLVARSSPSQSSTEWRLLDITFSVALTLIVEPWSGSPGGPPRFIIGAWLLTAAILQSLYSSKLIESYSILEYEKNPETIEDLISQGKTALILQGGTPMATIRHYRNKLKVQSFPHEVKPEQLNDPSKVTFYDPSWYMFEILDYGKRKPQEYHFARKPILAVFSAWLYSFEFDLSRELNLAILRTAQFGLIQKWFQEQFAHFHLYQRTRQGRDEETELKTSSLTVSNLNAVFFVWSAGMLSGLAAFAVEIMHWRSSFTRTTNNMRITM